MTMLRGLLFENLGLKLAALLLALVVYLNVYTDRPADMILSFPLQLDGLEDSLAIAGPTPAVVQAELRGTGKQLLRLRLTEPPLKVSLVGVTPGKFTRSFKVQDLPVPTGEGIEVERLVGPTTLTLQIDRRLVRRLPVAARVNGVPAPGYLWSGAVIARPAFIEVGGPASAVALLDSVRLRTITIAGRRDTVKSQETFDGVPEECSVDPAVVRLLVPITRVGH